MKAILYEKLHIEIYNDIEQKRLFDDLNSLNLKSNINSLDFGCGAGNLTAQFMSLGFNVDCADICEDNIRYVGDKYGVNSILIDDDDLNNFKDDYYDLIGLYSVIHHIPDYLKSIKLLLDKLKVGGILYIDHELNESYWKNKCEYDILFNKISKKNYFKYFNPINYFKYFIKRVHLFFNKKYNEEGDIHVYADDHIDWNKIKSLLNDCVILKEKDYPLFRGNYKEDLYNEFKGDFKDVKLLVIKKFR